MVCAHRGPSCTQTSLPTAVAGRNKCTMAALKVMAEQSSAGSGWKEIFCIGFWSLNSEVGPAGTGTSHWTRVWIWVFKHSQAWIQGWAQCQ